MDFSVFNTIFNLRTSKDLDDKKDNLPSIDVERDGSHVVSGTAYSKNSALVNEEVIDKSDVELIRTYRRISHYPEVSSAIDEIMNEMVIMEDGKDAAEISLDEAQKDGIISAKTRKIVEQEFKHVLNILDFNNNAYDIVRRWYVDSRIAYLMQIPKNMSEGVQSVTNLNPTRLRRIKIVDDSSDTFKVADDFYVYVRDDGTDRSNSERTMSHSAYERYKKKVIFKVSPHSIAYVDSGLVDQDTNMVYGHLHKAVKTANQLDNVENALVVYRLQNSADKQVVYVDTGTLPPAKQQAKVELVKRQFRRDPGYDSVRGTIADSSRFMSMSENIFLARGSNGKTTEIQQLNGGQNLGNIEDVERFTDKLYSALSVPISRFRDQSGVFSQSSEITRDELKFQRFIDRLRSKFSGLFIQILRIHLLTKEILTVEEFEELKPYIKIIFNRDNFFTELKETEIFSLRLEAAKEAMELEGIAYSLDFVRRDILKQSSEDIEEQDKIMDEERKKKKEIEDNFGSSNFSDEPDDDNDSSDDDEDQEE